MKDAIFLFRIPQSFVLEGVPVDQHVSHAVINGAGLWTHAPESFYGLSAPLSISRLNRAGQVLASESSCKSWFVVSSVGVIVHLLNHKGLTGS